MKRNNGFYDTVDQIVSYGKEKGILHLYTATDPFNGMRLVIKGKQVTNFGSCSYLGLEFNPALKAGATNAIEKYGTQFSESRAYVSIGLYKKLEILLAKLFGAYCVVTPTTTLGHIACIPVIVDDGDAVIMDQQVHNSVQTAVQLVKARGVHIELVRHNRMDLLEDRIKELRQKHTKIWYMADGIYSMFGDTCPVDDLHLLLHKYPEFHLYVDDAHGMSIHGKYGRGYVLSNHDIHAKMVMATSLNKAFASGGGVLVFGNKTLGKKVGNVGGPLLSSGPMQPSALGAAIASARMHLNTSFTDLQATLQNNIRFTTERLKHYKLPLISVAGAAIFFVGVSLPRLGHNIVRRMLDAGYYVNLGIFPTVPMKQTGIRFTITRLHSYTEIENMIAALAAIFPVAMEEESITMEEIYKGFKLAVPKELLNDALMASANRNTVPLKMFQYNSIKEIEKASWNKLFEGKGTFDWDSLQLLEKVFNGNVLPEDNWLFNYIIIKDREDHVIAASFFTTTVWKDDMLSPGSISEQLEKKRSKEPYHCTSRVICSGSLITEGEHLYINYISPLWKEALQLMLEKVYSLQQLHNANHIVLRDFHGIQPEVDSLMVDNGFFRIQMPDTHIIHKLSWEGPTEFLQALSVNSRRQLAKKVLRHQDKFDTNIVTGNVDDAELKDWYRLYLNVKDNSFELNTFALPFKLFCELVNSDNWEVIRLSLKNTSNNADTCCVIFCYKTTLRYIPMIIGLDYTHNKELNIYRQALYQLVLRAKELNKKQILLGFSATTEKQKLGAATIETYAYMHSDDTYNLEAMAALSLVNKATV